MKALITTEADPMVGFRPHGCSCKDGEEALSCPRCVEQRERIRQLYAATRRTP